MDCRAFRELHGDWVDDMLDPHEGDLITGHIAECHVCARFDTLARRALIVARNAPPIEVSADFSARLTARIAEERRRRIAAHAPSRAERRVLIDARGLVWVRRAAAVAAVVGGSMVVRGAMMRAASTTSAMGAVDSSALFASPGAMSFQAPSATSAWLTGGLSGEIVVVRSMRPMRGALLPFSDDPLMAGSDRAGFGETSATSVAATAPLWPTALMAAHAANRFAAMEFGDVIPVAAVQTPR